MAKQVAVGQRYMWLETCCSCNTPFAMSDEVHAIAMERREKFSFYCPNGHHQYYISGESEADKLRRERDQLTQRLAQKDDEIRAAWATANQQSDFVKAGERRIAAAKGQITKLKRRASNGVCPCCNRTFFDLQRHMHSKHPGFISEPDATDHVQH